MHLVNPLDIEWYNRRKGLSTFAIFRLETFGGNLLVFKVYRNPNGTFVKWMTSVILTRELISTIEHDNYDVVIYVFTLSIYRFEKRAKIETARVSSSRRDCASILGAMKIEGSQRIEAAPEQQLGLDLEFLFAPQKLTLLSIITKPSPGLKVLSPL